MSSVRYGRDMATTRQCAVAGCIVVLILTLAGCGGSTVTDGSAGSSTTPAPAGSDTSDDNAPTPAMVVLRTGGIAGVHDQVRIAADGTARSTRKTGKTRDCTPSTTSLERLRAIDLAALNAIPTTMSQLADGFNYSVKTGDASASASEGDDDSRRAEFVDAAAGVIASCLATQS